MERYTVELHLLGRWLSGSAWPLGHTFPYCNCTTSFYGLHFPQLSNTFKQLCIYVLFVSKLICRLKWSFVEFFPLQTANVAYFQRKIQLSGLSTYPDGSPSQLIRVSGVLLCSVRIKEKFML
jgi:hypothetical protein